MKHLRQKAAVTTNNSTAQNKDSEDIKAALDYIISSTFIALGIDGHEDEEPNYNDETLVWNHGKTPNTSIRNTSTAILYKWMDNIDIVLEDIFVNLDKTLESMHISNDASDLIDLSDCNAKCSSIIENIRYRYSIRLFDKGRRKALHELIGQDLYEGAIIEFCREFTKQLLLVIYKKVEKINDDLIDTVICNTLFSLHAIDEQGCLSEKSFVEIAAKRHDGDIRNEMIGCAFWSYITGIAVEDESLYDGQLGDLIKTLGKWMSLTNGDYLDECSDGYLWMSRITDIPNVIRIKITERLYALYGDLLAKFDNMTFGEYYGKK